MPCHLFQYVLACDTGVRRCRTRKARGFVRWEEDFSIAVLLILVVGEWDLAL